MLKAILSDGQEKRFNRNSIVLIVDPGAIPGKTLYVIIDGLQAFTIERQEYCRIERQIKQGRRHI